mgnify:CR=1 FL=1
MLLPGATFPRFFMSIGRALGVSLLITIIVELLSNIELAIVTDAGEYDLYAKI